LVAVEHRGCCDSIDSSDGRSKETLVILETISRARIAEAVEGRTASPILTVPCHHGRMVARIAAHHRAFAVG
jgi:hypothetical protein